MELKQKAKDLIYKFYRDADLGGTLIKIDNDFVVTESAKKCAVICTQIEYHEKRELLYNLKSCGVNISDEVYLYRLQELIDEEKELVKQISVL